MELKQVLYVHHGDRIAPGMSDKFKNHDITFLDFQWKSDQAYDLISAEIRKLFPVLPDQLTRLCQAVIRGINWLLRRSRTPESEHVGKIIVLFGDDVFATEDIKGPKRYALFEKLCQDFAEDGLVLALSTRHVTKHRRWALEAGARMVIDSEVDPQELDDYLFAVHRAEETALEAKKQRVMADIGLNVIVWIVLGVFTPVLTTFLGTFAKHFAGQILK